MADPTMAQIRAAIKAKIETVADVGIVHEYERYTKLASSLQAMYVSDGKLLGWNIRRVSTRETSPDIDRWSVHHAWRIRGYMSLDDAAESEITFDALIEAIRDAFRDDDDLGGLIFSCVNAQNKEAGVQVIDSRPVLFAGVLCHFAELGLMTQHLHP